jgi:hypothetical protein
MREEGEGKENREGEGGGREEGRGEGRGREAGDEGRAGGREEFSNHSTRAAMPAVMVPSSFTMLLTGKEGEGKEKRR